MATRQERIAAMERDYFKEDKAENPRDRTRIVPMQVMNLSFPRTGSISIQTALNMLGFSCYHGIVFFSQIRDTEMWNEALDAKFGGKGKPFGRQEWDQLLGHHSAISADVPPICFAEDLINAYPEAKVILVERDIDAWYKSYDHNVMKAVHDPWINWIGRFDNRLIGPLAACHHKWATYFMDGTDLERHRANAKRVYREHYELVRRVTPKDRLLEFKLQDGWQPLCNFLGKDVPDVAFPHVHDSEAVWDMLSIVIRRGIWNAGWAALESLTPGFLKR